MASGTSRRRCTSTARVATKADFDACVGADPDNPPATPACPAEDGPDTVTFDGSTAFHGHQLAVFADTITVNETVVLDTRDRDVSGATIGDSGAISLGRRQIEHQDRGAPRGRRDGRGLATRRHRDRRLHPSVRRPAPRSRLSTSRSTRLRSRSPARPSSAAASRSARRRDIGIPTTSAPRGRLARGLKNLADQVPDLVLSSHHRDLRPGLGPLCDRVGTATGATIVAAGAVSLASSASTDASIQAVSFNGTRATAKFAVAIAYGQAYSRAETTVAGDEHRRGRRCRHQLDGRRRTRSSRRGPPRIRAAPRTPR